MQNLVSQVQEILDHIGSQHGHYIAMQALRHPMFKP